MLTTHLHMGKRSMRYRIIEAMQKDTYWDVDELLVYLKTVDGIETTRKTIQQRMVDLCREGLVKRVMFGVYQWSDYDNRKASQEV